MNIVINLKEWGILIFFAFKSSVQHVLLKQINKRIILKTIVFDQKITRSIQSGQ